jgi:ADP-heptose:LPS heptosyltransferase
MDGKACAKLSIIRKHGLGNVVLLMPVLQAATKQYMQVELVTNSEWIDTFSVLYPKISFLSEKKIDQNCIDLDNLTLHSLPNMHRTKEFAEILKVETEPTHECLKVPNAWKRPFQTFKDFIVFAPEAGHNARKMPSEYVTQMDKLLKNKRVCIVGRDTSIAIEHMIDKRGTLSLTELYGLISVSRCVVAMDSAILHIATSLGVPAVAIFSGIDPEYRLNSDSNVIALVADVECRPCNKVEVCGGSYDCLRRISPYDIIRALNSIEHSKSLQITKV